MILAGDIGGTKTYLGLFNWPETKNSPPILAGEIATYLSRDYAERGLVAMIEEFLAKSAVNKETIKAASFGVAGPVDGGCGKLSNLNWVITEPSLSEFLNVPVALINDLEAMGYGVPLLPPDRLEPLNPEVTPDPKNDQQPRAVIAAGTGLGEAGLLWEEREHIFRPLPSEGGHADFAPCNKRQTELLRYLLEREEFGGHVSYERVLSGPGLFNLYQFLQNNQEDKTENPEVNNRLEQEHSKPEEMRSYAAIISEMALAKKSPICEQALDEFMSIYGAEAGNLVLRYKALGG
ncbi:MAG: hypothetical protein BWK78_02330, partial [Thiotrichaceae bacterium IS1]